MEWNLVYTYTYVSCNKATIMNYFRNDVKVKGYLVSIAFRCVEHNEIVIPANEIISLNNLSVLRCPLLVVRCRGAEAYE